MDNVQSQAANLARPNRHYFTAWRWHFYAGLYVIPFLLVLAPHVLFLFVSFAYCLYAWYQNYVG